MGCQVLVVLKMAEFLQNSHCMVFVLLLIMRHYLEMPVDRNMKRCDFEYLYSDKAACCKQLDRHVVTILLSNIEEMATTSTVSLRQNGSAIEIQVPCHTLSKFTTKEWVLSTQLIGVDLIYHLDEKSTIRLYLCTFFEMMDVACANSYAVYNMMPPNDLTLINFLTIVSTYLIGRYTPNQKSSARQQNTFHNKSISFIFSKVTYHHIFQSFKIFEDNVNIATKQEVT